MSNRELLKDDILSLSALLSRLTNGDDEALRTLEALHSPPALRRRILLLNSLRRFDEVPAAVKDAPENVIWMEPAVRSFAAIEDFRQAQALLGHIKIHADIPERYLSALYELCAGIFAAWEGKKAHRNKGGGVSPRLAEGIEIAVNELRPVVAASQRDEELRSRIIHELVTQSAILKSLLGLRGDSSAELDLLSKSNRPFPLHLAKLIANGEIVPTSAVDRRFPDFDHDGVETTLFGCLIKARFFNKSEEAAVSVLDIARTFPTLPEPDLMPRVLIELYQSVAEPVKSQVQETIDALTDGPNQFDWIWGSIQALSAGELQPARALLDEHADGSSEWHQLNAEYLRQKGDAEGCINAMKKAIATSPDFESFIRLAEYASQHGHPTIAKDSLENAVKLRPDDPSALRNLARMEYALGDYAKAAEHLETAINYDENSVDLFMLLANALMQQHDYDKALSILKRAAEKNITVDLLLAFATVLALYKGANAAIRHLEQYKDQFWSEKDFVFAYQDMARRAGNEQAAHEAFEQLVSLKHAGLISDEEFRSGTLDELRNILIQDRTREIESADRIVRCRQPWTLAVPWKQTSLDWEWTVKTQPIDWLPVTVTARAAYGIYASNQFVVLGRGSRDAEIVQLEAPQTLERLVIDYSALISLQRLKLLETTLSSVKTIELPSSYQSLSLTEKMQLQPVQPSRQKSARDVMALIEKRAISEVDVSKSGIRTVVAAHDDVQDVEFFDRLPVEAFLEELESKGLLSNNVIETCSKLAFSDRGTLGAGVRLNERKNEVILFGLETLRTLAGVGALSPLTQRFKVAIDQQSVVDLKAEIRTFDAAGDARKQHEEMWRCIREATNVRFRPKSALDQLDRAYAVTDSLLLARELRTPLLADDRVLQSIVSQNHSDPLPLSSTHIVDYLFEKEAISADDRAGAYLSLMTWRYRFILVPADVLVRFAERYRRGLPGQALAQVAEYLHTSIEDPGLLFGAELPNSTLSVGELYVNHWVRNLATFLVQIQEHAQFSGGEKESLSVWSISHLLPGVPRNAPEFPAFSRTGERASLLIRMIANQALMGVNIKSVRSALQLVKSYLEVSDDDYYQAIDEIVRFIDE